MPKDPSYADGVAPSNAAKSRPSRSVKKAAAELPELEAAPLAPTPPLQLPSPEEWERVWAQYEQKQAAWKTQYDAWLQRCRERSEKARAERLAKERKAAKAFAERLAKEREAEQERRTQEQQERARQTEQIEKLERSRLDLEERLNSIRALIDKAIDGVNVQANLIAAKALTARQRAAGERSGKVRANKAWHAAARKIINDNPKLGHAALVRKIRKEAKPPVEPRMVERFVTDELSRK